MITMCIVSVLTIIILIIIIIASIIIIIITKLDLSGPPDAGRSACNLERSAHPSTLLYSALLYYTILYDTI